MYKSTVTPSPTLTTEPVKSHQIAQVRTEIQYKLKLKLQHLALKNQDSLSCLATSKKVIQIGSGEELGREPLLHVIGVSALYPHPKTNPEIPTLYITLNTHALIMKNDPVRCKHCEYRKKTLANQVPCHF